jgi:C_GCAxxG_C_C family probable redox protein
MNRAETAAEHMRTGFNCCQAVVKAFASELCVEERAAVKMAASFGGGMGRNGYVCGALSGAAFILGARYGNSDPANTAAREKTYAAVNDLLERFQKEHGTVLCRELISINMKDPGELKRAREEGIFAKRCPLFVQSAGSLLEELLAAGQSEQ